MCEFYLYCWLLLKSKAEYLYDESENIITLWERYNLFLEQFDLRNFGYCLSSADE